MISSQKDSFLKAYKEGKNFIPIVETWPADLETPLSTWLKLSSKDSHGVFLESVEGGENLGRWSIVATQPLWEAVCYGEKIVKTWNNGKTEIHKGDPFDILKSWTMEYKSTMLDDLPSIGQLYGSWGYELINRIEPSVPINEIPENNIPYGSWMFFDQLVVFDQIKRCITAVVYADTTSSKECSIEELYLNSISKIQKTEQLDPQQLISGRNRAALQLACSGNANMRGDLNPWIVTKLLKSTHIKNYTNYNNILLFIDALLTGTIKYYKNYLIVLFLI